MSQVGDQILRVNGFSIEQAIHEEVIALIKSTPTVTLKVKSVGLIPVKEIQTKNVSWKYVEPVATCPIHNRWPSKTALLAASTPPSSSSSHSSTSETELFQNFSIAGNDYMEAKVFISLATGQGLGCSVVKGPNSYPGIFVQIVKKGGVAEESGLEIGDQIVGINGTSLEPGDIEFNEAIAMIKSCQQMTLTVRKKSGLNLFRSQKQKIKALVHSNPNDDFGSNHHLPLSSKQSTSSSGSSDNPRYFDPSEHDFSMSEVESNGNDQIVKIPRVNQSSWMSEKTDLPVSLSEKNGEDETNIATAKKMYEEVRKEEERLCEERKKLEAEQKRLQSELEKLEKERKQLENLKQDECKSISSASTVSGSQSVSSVGSGSQVSFLDEIKKLAERRNGEDALITDTLNKTRAVQADASAPLKSKSFAPDNDKRKRHGN
ncbi:pdzk7-like protein [Leptotrombidium deliense]|uniref:Pdzk7-like protein n=1 Tax=Leptotrombidium deliense TaxID=299467 RepID=A0A443SRS5_9ACAR|nr:pdzk7-like protein [Leptotrombidium deliense]